MTKQAHTPAERAHLLAAVGAPAEAVEAAAAGEEEAPKPKRERKAKASDPKPQGLEHDVPTVVQSIVTKAGASRDMALQLCDTFAQDVFDANKVSKLEGAARGIESSTHNKDLWTAVQNLRSALKKGVRDHYKTTIAAKVRKTSAHAEAKDDEQFQAFISSDALMTAFEAWKEAQKGS